MKRICTTCASLGKRVEAKFVAAAERGPAELSELLWFECADHGPNDNVAGVKREGLEPIDAFFARAGISLDALPDRWPFRVVVTKRPGRRQSVLGNRTTRPEVGGNDLDPCDGHSRLVDEEPPPPTERTPPVLEHD